MEKSLSEEKVIYELRMIYPEEGISAAKIEAICFPPNEACTKEMMLARVRKAPELFLAAIEKSTGEIIGFLNGLSTNEAALRDEFFTNPDLYDPDGKNVMLLGLDVLPKYRGQGIASALVKNYAERAKKQGREMLILTCHEEKIAMYEKMGFRDRGWGQSVWGGEPWHEMEMIL